jgi:hypothetical protein
MVATLTAACDTSGAGEIGSDQPGVQRYQPAKSATPTATVRFDVFPGGCLTTRLEAPPDDQPQLTADVAQLLGFTARQRLDQLLERRSGGRLHLDPASPR